MYFINIVLYLNTVQIEIHVTFVIGCLCEDFFRYNFMKYFFYVLYLKRSPNVFTMQYCTAVKYHFYHYVFLNV